MNYEQLITKLITLAPFEDADDARIALSSSLETFGFLLPERLVRELEAALPGECATPLALGLSANRRRTQTGRGEREDLPLRGQTLERVQETARALRKLLPPELVAQLQDELPAQLAEAFADRPVSDFVHVREVQDDSAGARHLSQARVGSHHPLSSGRPPGAHQESVAAENPHGDTKLSSARGLTQERETETLADSHKRRMDH